MEWSTYVHNFMSLYYELILIQDQHLLNLCLIIFNFYKYFFKDVLDYFVLFQIRVINGLSW